LPNPSDHPNAGSFFKNPFVDVKKAKQLQSVHPLLKSYPQEDGVKFSAAQLIDLDGWKGRSQSAVGCWESQPLVLVNQNQASAKDVLEFADQITQSIKKRYGVSLEIELSILS
jgi:UDP-N-acetylmuramate dehydrogenase